MKQSKTIILIALLMLTVSVRCSSKASSVSSETENTFRVMFPDVTMNEAFDLKTKDNGTTFTKGSSIIIELTNKSPHTILFDPSSFIKLFTFENEKWVEVQNNASYSGQLVLSPQGTILTDRGLTGVRPILENNAMNDANSKSMLRIVMVGEITEEDLPSGKFVGAYMDVFLVP